MRSAVVVLVVLAACDLRPAPKQAPKPPAATVDAGRPALIDIDASAGDAGPPSADACLQVGAHIGELWVATATDAAQKALYEQERTKTVKNVADTCTRDAWSEAARTCHLQATKWLDMQSCAPLLVKRP